jgi:hypothetical protein
MRPAVNVVDLTVFIDVPGEVQIDTRMRRKNAGGFSLLGDRSLA